MRAVFLVIFHSLDFLLTVLCGSGTNVTKTPKKTYKTHARGAQHGGNASRLRHDVGPSCWEWQHVCALIRTVVSVLFSRGELDVRIFGNQSSCSYIRDFDFLHWYLDCHRFSTTKTVIFIGAAGGSLGEGPRGRAREEESGRARETERKEDHSKAKRTRESNERERCPGEDRHMRKREETKRKT